MELTSINNPRVKGWIKLKEKKYRDREQKFLIEGAHLIEEAYRAGWLETLIVRQGITVPTELNLPVYEVTNEIMKRLSTLSSGENVMGVCKISENEAFRTDITSWILLDGIQDPGNMGTILRTALAFGIQRVILSKDCVDVYHDKVVRATQGAIFHLSLQRTDLAAFIKVLEDNQIPVFATALHDALPLQEMKIPARYALVFGNEGNGIRSNILTLCDQRIKIEMATFESLNVAVAAGIAMYYFQYQGGQMGE